METALRGQDPASQILDRAARLSLAEMADLRRWRGIEISIGARPPASSPLLTAEGQVRRVLGKDRTREVRRRVLEVLDDAVGRQVGGFRRWWAVRATAPVVEDALLAVLAADQLPADHLEALTRPWQAATAPGSRTAGLVARERYAGVNSRWSKAIVGSLVALLPALLFILPVFPERAVREAILYGVGAVWVALAVGLFLWRVRRLRELGSPASAEIAGIVIILGTVLLIVALSVGR